MLLVIPPLQVPSKSIHSEAKKIRDDELRYETHKDALTTDNGILKLLS